MIEKCTPSPAWHDWSSMFFKENAMNHNFSGASWSQLHGTGKGIFMTGLKPRDNIHTSFTQWSRYDIKYWISHMKAWEWIIILLFLLLMMKDELKHMFISSNLSQTHSWLQWVFVHIIELDVRCFFFTRPSAKQQMITTFCFPYGLFDVRVLYFIAVSQQLKSYWVIYISWDYWQGWVWNNNPLFFLYLHFLEEEELFCSSWNISYIFYILFSRAWMFQRIMQKLYILLEIWYNQITLLYPILQEKLYIWVWSTFHTILCEQWRCWWIDK